MFLCVTYEQHHNNQHNDHGNDKKNDQHVMHETHEQHEKNHVCMTEFALLFLPLGRPAPGAGGLTATPGGGPVIVR